MKLKLKVKNSHLYNTHMKKKAERNKETNKIFFSISLKEIEWKTEIENPSVSITNKVISDQDLCCLLIKQT